MNVYLDPKKLLQEGKITPSEFERIKGISSIWNSPYIPCIVVALIVVWGAMIMCGVFIAFFLTPILILIGIIVLVLERMRAVREDSL